MNAREVIAYMRLECHPCGMKRVAPEEALLLADLAEEGLAGLRELIESECLWIGENDAADANGWWDTRYMIDVEGDPFPLTGDMTIITRALSLLSRAGEIERKEGAEHMVRFVEAGK